MLSWEQFKSIIQWLFDLNKAQFKSIIHHPGLPVDPKLSGAGPGLSGVDPGLPGMDPEL